MLNMTQTWKIILSVVLVPFSALLVAFWFDALPENIPGMCHQRPTNFKTHLSSMAPYRFVANTEDSPIVFSGCHATRFWGLFRHGTRNPTEKLIKNAKALLFPLKDEIVKNYNSGKGSLCASDISLLNDWTMYLHEGESFDLREEGARELKGLGKRFKKRFPGLLSEMYNDTYYEFFHTSTTRTAESASNFSLGVFGDDFKSEIKYKDTAESDYILRFYKFCDKWTKEVKNSNTTKTEKILFENGPEVKKVRENVSKRLGLAETVSVDVILLMYAFCAFGIAWNDSYPSAWCSPFTEHELEVLQYVKDLNHYAKSGYKSEITYKQACPTIKNVFDFFNSSQNDNPKVKFNFAHSGTILKFLAGLGLYGNPLHLRASDFSSNINREWKGSIIDSFAANIVFVLFECGDEKKVLTLHQEKPIALPGCPELPKLCPLDIILEQYKNPIKNCNLQDMCSV